jgi:amino acid transporter
MNTQAPATRPRPGSFLRSVKAVTWSFVGIRKKSEYEEDLGRINPLHIIVVALLGVVLFVGGLVMLVHWVVGR